ncbi:upf0496 protein at3g19330 [Phtheirospermum japonicum]|uniref:Upf0496 protein at3g19330 n=1 Tax=Phtheirospermum japonicum TaxID=374723 RepID=A0A830CZY5_9LAMI|nr:upf0496 protein at3g19330 [Phtheirospermum japonicum]
MPLIKGEGSMLSCLKLPQPPTNNHFSSPASQGHSGDNTPASSVQLSPTINLSREYTLALQTHSYGEIRRTFDQDTSHNVETGHVDIVPDSPHLLSQVLQPSRECVLEILSQITPNSLTHLVTTYFEHTERTSRLCLHLHHSIHHAHLLYAPIHNLLDVLPLDSDAYSLSDSQSSSAFNIFLQFDRLGNPFLPPDAHNFDDMRNCFSELRQQLDRHIGKSKSRVDQMRNCSTGSALCLIAATVGVVVSAVAIASHALVALVAGPFCPVILALGCGLRKRCLHAAVENDRFFVRWGLERGVDGHSILEVLKQIRRNQSSLVQQFKDLKEHIFLCFIAINRARANLLKELPMHQSPV